MTIRREWSMPSAETFQIPCVAELIERWTGNRKCIVDPFARNSTIGHIRNDLNPNTAAQHHLDAIEFCAKLRRDGIVADAALFDPPYSPRQIAECYQQVGRAVTKQDTLNCSLYAKVKDSLADVMAADAIAVSCGWNSSGFGKKRAFEMLEILFICHGGAHNDTIVTVERKTPDLFSPAAAIPA
jgi:hypothetical protein